MRRSRTVLAGFVVDDLVGRMAARHRKYLRGIEPAARDHLAAACRGDVQALLNEIEQVIGIARDGAMITRAHVRAVRTNGRKK